jgi:hypothetical protein
LVPVAKLAAGTSSTTIAPAVARRWQVDGVDPGVVGRLDSRSAAPCVSLCGMARGYGRGLLNRYRITSAPV